MASLYGGLRAPHISREQSAAYTALARGAGDEGCGRKKAAAQAQQRQPLPAKL